MKINKDREIRRKIKKLIPKYNQDKYIIGGNISENVYVQFVPALKGYHLYKNRICSFILEDIDLRKRLICPTCGEDLTKELRGEKL